MGIELVKQGISRRGFLKSVAGVGAAATLSSLSLSTALGADERRMNLLVIHTDEHNFRTLGCYREHLSKEQAFMWGDAVVETPNIDWIAKNGALCMNFYVTTPLCSPSRGSFVSGRYPQNTPVVSNNVPLNDDVITFAEILRRQGYSTGYAGKWHLNGSESPEWQPARKFGFEDNRYMYNRGHWKMMEDTPNGPQIKAKDAAGKPSYGIKGADEKSFTTDFLTDKTIDFINTNKSTQFCYMVSYPDPHGPDSVRAPYDTMFKSMSFKEPRTFNISGKTLPSWAQPKGDFDDMAPYYGMIKCIDDNIGRIFDKLRAERLMDKTIIVFTADHGDLRGEHHRQDKHVPFEGSTKIPFVIYFPNKIKAGTIVSQVLNCADFLPTIINLMDYKTVGKEDGRDASSLFVTGKAPTGWDDITFMREAGKEKGWLAAVTPQYKIVYSSKDDPWLFDLQKDPDEVTNRFLDPACRQIVREMSVKLAAYCQKYNDPRITDPRIKADINWAINGRVVYKSSPSMPIEPVQKQKKSKPKNEEE